MMRKIGLLALGLVAIILLSAFQSAAQDDKIVKVAIDTVKTQLHLPKEIEVKFIEKKESPIRDFYSVKLLLITQDKEIPFIVYVDKAGEKLFIGGSLVIKGENVTLKEAGAPRIRKVDMGQLGIEKSPSRGPLRAKITIVEFSNFECPYCQASWIKMKEWIERYPEDIRYVFKHFPFQSQGEPFDLSEIAAAAQRISDEAFWVVHDFFFSNDGQALIKEEKSGVKQRIEALLKEKGFDVKPFQVAFETGQGRRKVEEDMTLGKSIRVTGTPTILMNGEFVANPMMEKVLEQHLRDK
jgi:protein-disulfide isomerase